jgi:hypothetical protein
MRFIGISIYCHTVYIQNAKESCKITLIHDIYFVIVFQSVTIKVDRDQGTQKTFQCK